MIMNYKGKFRHFFLILLSWLRNNAQSQQQKNKVRFGSLLRGEVVGGSVVASSFGWFLGDFGWFLLVEGDFGWFQVVCCFSTYIGFTAYRTLNLIDWGHSIFLFKVKQQEKFFVVLSSSCLKISDYFLYSAVFNVR